MRKFIVNLLSNRFGIVLATLNVCYFLSASLFQRAFAHAHGESCFFAKGFFLVPVILSKTESLMFFQNLPALTFSLIPHLLLREFSPDICVDTQVKFQIFFFTIFIILQWLFIAWIAKMLAARIQRSIQS